MTTSRPHRKLPPIRSLTQILTLEEIGKLETYMSLLVDNFNPDAVDQLMCKNYVSVKWDGTIYDCDFNQQAPHLPTQGLEAEDHGVKNPRGTPTRALHATRRPAHPSPQHQP